MSWRFRRLAISSAWVTVLSVCFIMLSGRDLQGQQSRTSDSSAPSTVTGTIFKPTKDTTIGVPNVWVTLHRVGRDSAGPIDSVRTDAKGRYRMTYRPFGSPDAVYFTASVYHGIAYFSLPLGRAQLNAASADNIGFDELQGEGDITVFDTTSGPVPLSIRGRHLVVGTPNSAGERKITEVYEISNDSFVTKVAVGDAPSGASWSAILPEGVQSPTLLEGDLPKEAVKFTDGRILVYSPFAPGLKQIAYTYTLKENAFPFSLPIEGETTVLEVLTEEFNARVSGARLQQVAPATIEGRQFRRYLASNVPANAVISVEVAEVERPINPLYVAILTLIIGGAMVGTLVWTMRRRR
jgi:hypothetical protein